MSDRFGTGSLDWATLTADDLTEFDRQEVSVRKNFGRKVPGTALRVMLRYPRRYWRRHFKRKKQRRQQQDRFRHK